MATDLSARAAQLIDALRLLPHLEGGHYREVFRSASHVQPQDARSRRPALTTIYFLLARGEVSRWHRVASDEAWHFYEGDPLELLTADAALGAIERHRLGAVGAGTQPVHVVPAGRWQAARTTGAYTLAGCTVGPGFDFQDFEMLHERPEQSSAMRARHPDVEAFL